MNTLTQDQLTRIRSLLAQKNAFAPNDPAAAGGAPPMDPAAAGGAMPPAAGDPAAMGAMPPMPAGDPMAMDPAAMAAPPMDPSQGAMPPMPAGDPSQAAAPQDPIAMLMQMMDAIGQMVFAIAQVVGAVPSGDQGGGQPPTPEEMQGLIPPDQAQGAAQAGAAQDDSAQIMTGQAQDTLNGTVSTPAEAAADGAGAPPADRGSYINQQLSGLNQAQQG